MHNIGAFCNTLVLIIIEIIDSKYQLLHACGKRVMKEHRYV